MATLGGGGVVPFLPTVSHVSAHEVEQFALTLEKSQVGTIVRGLVRSDGKTSLESSGLGRLKTVVAINFPSTKNP